VLKLVEEVGRFVNEPDVLSGRYGHTAARASIINQTGYKPQPGPFSPSRTCVPTALSCADGQRRITRSRSPEARRRCSEPAFGAG
jgi:hypothetical protein